MSKEIREFNSTIESYLDECIQAGARITMTSGSWHLTKERVKDLYKKIAEEERRVKSGEDDMKELLCDLKAKIEAAQEVRKSQNFQLPLNMSWEDKLTNFSTACKQFIFNNQSSSRKAFEIGFLLNDLFINFACRRYENRETMTWSDWYIKSVGRRQNSISLRQERKLRKFYRDTENFQQVLMSGLSFSDLNSKLKLFHMAIQKFPEAKDFFSRTVY